MVRKGARYKEWLNEWKTRLTGYAIVVLGALQASSMHLATVMSDTAYNRLMIVLGVLVALFGHMNSRQ